MVDLKNKLLDTIELAKKNADQIHLTLLCYIHDNKTENLSPYSIETEFFSYDEFDELITNAQNFGFYVDVYHNQNEFFQDVVTGRYFQITKSYHIVYDTTQKGNGMGKDALIPAFCDLHGILYTGTNPYVNALTSNKYDWNKLLEAHGIPVPLTQKLKITTNEEKLLFDETQKVILKPNSTYASIGITENAVVKTSEKIKEHAESLKRNMKQSIIVQEYIEGYEVEIGMITNDQSNYILPPVGISIDNSILLKDQFLSFEKVAIDNYEFYSFDKLCSTNMKKRIQTTCNKIAMLLDAKGHIRIDLRVNKELTKYYVFDINVYPHIVSHSSFSYSFKLLGINPELILPCLVGNALINSY